MSLLAKSLMNCSYSSIWYGPDASFARKASIVVVSWYHSLAGGRGGMGGQRRPRTEDRCSLLSLVSTRAFLLATPPPQLAARPPSDCSRRVAPRVHLATPRKEHCPKCDLPVLVEPGESLVEWLELGGDCWGSERLSEVSCCTRRQRAAVGVGRSSVLGSRSTCILINKSSREVEGGRAEGKD